MDTYVRYTVHKPPYRNTVYDYGDSAEKAQGKCGFHTRGCTCMPAPTQTAREEKRIGGMTRGELYLHCLETTPETAGLCNDGGSARDAVAGDTGNTPAAGSNDTKRTGEGGQSTDRPPPPKGMPPPERSDHKAVAIPPQKSPAKDRPADAAAAKNCDQASRGLLHYRNWWERTGVDISVYGKLISGIPIFTEENTLRVVNDKYSYFIPLEKIDYIRTSDGLDSCATLPDGTTQGAYSKGC